MSPTHPQPIPWFRINAFGRRLGEGNPCVVLLFPREESRFEEESWLKTFAREMDTPATAFLREVDAAAGCYSVRWFAPSDEEIQLCGHGTLAAAHALAEHHHMSHSKPHLGSRTHPFRLLTREYGEIEAWLRSDDVAEPGDLADTTATSRRVEFTFPALQTEPIEEPARLREGLGGQVQPRFVGLCDGKLLVELAEEADVRRCIPHVPALLAANRYPTIVTAPAAEGTSDYDFVSRVFYLREDPVTGSAHAGLAPYWSARLGKRRLVGFQASERGGVVHVELSDDGTRTLLGGPALTLVRGQLE